MKKILQWYRKGSIFSIYVDKGLIKALSFFLLIVCLHDLVEKGADGFMAPIVDWLYEFNRTIGIILYGAYFAWRMLNDDHFFDFKKEVDKDCH